MKRFFCTVILTAVVSLVAVGTAVAGGNLYLERYLERYDNGVAGTYLFVYDDQGRFIHSGEGNGSHSPAEEVELEEGWYWVEVSRFRTEHNLQRIYVEEGRTTVVPTGWVSVTTIPVDEQPSSCDQWNAELTAFRVDANGDEHLVSSNRGSGVDEHGMIQLPVGPFAVYFHGFPIEVDVQAGQVYRIPTGFQGPVAGERGQIALHEEGSADNTVMALCEEDNLHLPAGEYWTSRIVPSDVYPFEERVWNRVVVPATNDGGYVALRAERVSRRYSGEGSEPQLITVEQTEVLSNYQRGIVAGSTNSGFDLTLP